MEGNVPTKEEVMRELEAGNRVGTGRQALMEMGFGDMMSQLSPEAKAHGKLIGKLIENGHSYPEIESAFTWFEVEHNNGVTLDWRLKMLCLFQAAESLGCDQRHYNLIRKMFVTANNSD